KSSFSKEMWQLLLPTLLLANGTNWLNPILAKSYKDKPFETVVLLTHSQKEYERMDLNSSWPVLNFNEKMEFLLKKSFNSEVLVLVFQTGNTRLDDQLWTALDRNLLNMRRARLLLVRKWEEKPSEELDRIPDHLRFMYVAVVVSGNRIYRLQPYAPERWKLVDLNQGCMLPRIRNFYGRSILTLPDQMEPRSIAYRNNETGEIQMTGYVYKFLREFIRVYNFTFKWERPIVPGDHMTLFVLRNMTLNGTINMPISLCGFEKSTKFGVFSTVLDMEKWLVMVPCAHEISTAQVYLEVTGGRFLAVLVIFYYLFTILDTCFGPVILQTPVNWSNLVFNERIMSGIIGQSFRMSATRATSSRVTNATLFFLGMVLSSLYAAHLKTLLTKHPTSRQISNFEELRDSPVSVLFDEAEHFYFDKIDSGRPVDAIRSKISFIKSKEFHKLKRETNMSRAFSTLMSEWQILAKKQELYRQPAFCSLPGLWIISTNVLLTVPMQANSIYEEPLNAHINRVHDAGLLEHWKKQTLLEMVSLKIISQKDPFPYVAFREFKVGDLFWIWCLLGICLLLSFLVFLCELVVAFWMKKC
ncbi:hypothetical protein KR074_011640, partial [Drosophila pseudoananassae]